MPHNRVSFQHSFVIQSVLQSVLCCFILSTAIAATFHNATSVPLYQVQLKCAHALGMGSYSNTEQQYSIVARQRASVRFKLAVRGDTEAGGLEVLYRVQHTSES